MRTGPTKKHDFEKGKHKAKVQNPHYKDELTATRETRDPGGLEPTHITLRDVFKLSGFRKELRYDQARAVEVYHRQIRGMLLLIGRWRFRFKFVAADFARENGISLAESERVLPGVKADADDRFRRTRQLATRTPLECCESIDPATGQSKAHWRLRFTTFLPTIEPFDWSKAYKRVEICPQMPQRGEGS